MSIYPNLRKELKAYERQRICDALISFGWNKHNTAKHLGIGLSSLYRKIAKLKIKKPKMRSNRR